MSETIVVSGRQETDQAFQKTVSSAEKANDFVARATRLALGEARTLVIDISDTSQTLLRAGTSTQTVIHASDKTKTLDVNEACFRRAIRRCDTVELRVRPDQVLLYALTIPTMSAAEIVKAVKQQINRVTPFSIEDVCWGLHTTKIKDLDKRIGVSLTIVPLIHFAQVKRALSLREAPRVIHLVSSCGTSPEMRFGSGFEFPLRLRSSSRGVLLLLFLFCLVSPYIQNEYAIGKSQRELEAITSELETVSGIAQKHRKLAEQLRLLHSEIGATNDPSLILVKLTRALADDTFLTSLTYKDTSIEVSGISSNVPGVLRRIAQVRSFTGVTLFGVVKRTTDGRDTFSVRARLRQ